MSAEEKHLYARYFYNCIIEFLYFIVLYIETYGSASLGNLSKYVKLFKTEVSTFILIFEGKTAEDKLKQMLLTLDCFEFSDDEIKNLKRANLKHAIYEDFVLSKCVDLLLKGLSNVNDICRNLSLNPIIKINKQNFLDVIEKYNFIQINSDQKVSLNHAHGLLGFQDHLYNSITSYFHNILYHDKLLSFNEVRNHYDSLLFCGLSNILGVFSILYCSSEFNCQNGFILLKKKSKKHTNKKPLHMEFVETKFLSRSLPIGQIVYSSQGPFLYQWTGEIGTLRKDCGVIYCVVNFTNGYQGVFNIYFNKANLKVISEIDNLQNYISVRDVVEFDAEYYTGKKLDRCWTATRVKLLSNNKLQYDELLIAKLNLDSELQRNKCNNSMCCSDVVIPINYKSRNFSVVKQSNYLERNLKTTDSKFHEEELKIEDNKSVLNNNSMCCSDIVVPIKSTARNSSIIEQSKLLESNLETTDPKCYKEELKIEDNKSLLNNSSMCCSDIVIPIKCTARNSSIIEQSKFLESNLETSDAKCHEEELKIEDNQSVLNNNSMCCSDIVVPIKCTARNSSIIEQSKFLESNLETTDPKCHEEELKIEDNNSLLNNNSLCCSDIVTPINCIARNSFMIEQSQFLESNLETTDPKCYKEELKIEDNKSLLNNSSICCSDIVIPIKCTARNPSIIEQSKILESNLESTDPKCHEEELKIEDNSLLNNNSMHGSDIITPIKCTARNSSIIEESKFLESSLETTDSKCHEEGLKIEDHKSLLCNLDYKVEPDVGNSKKPVSLNEEKSSTLFISFTNSVIPDYHFMFAHIHMLMSDKGIAVAKYEDQFYNILFMKSSIYPPTESEQFLPKGQKVLVLIPYLNKVENFCVATLVYGLDEDDLRKLNTVDTTAEEFAMSRIFPLFTKNGINPAFCECFCFANGSKFDQIKYEIQLTELNDFIAKQYNISLAKDKFQMLLHSLYKANSNGSRFFDQFCSFTIDLSRCFSNYTQQGRDKLKNRRKFSRVVVDYENDSQHNINLKDFCVDVLKDSAKEDRLSNSNSSIKSKSLDAIHTSYNSLNSYKTFSDSTESFYSCESRCNTPKCLSKSLANSCSSLNSQKSLSKTDSLCLSKSLANSCSNLSSQKSSLKTDSPCLSKSLANSSSSDVSLNSQKSSPKTDSLLKINQTTPLPTLFDEYSIVVTNVDEKFIMKAQKCLQTENNKYLSLQSVPSFKPSCKKKRKMFILPFMPKPFSKNCIQSTITITGSACMVSESFFFFAVNIHSFDTVLPLPKKDVPKSFVGKIKLNSAYEITIKPYVPVHLSQIIRVKLV